MFIFHQVFFILSLAICSFAKSGGKIVGGENADIKNFPYQISFQYKNRHFCGGSIYNEQWIVTAAHCVDIFESASDLAIMAGITHLNETDGQNIVVEQFFAHPQFNRDTIDYDVALLKLSAPLVFNDKVKNIPLSDKTPSNRAMGVVSGWGTTQRGGGGDVSNDLKSAEVRVENPMFCQLQYMFQLTDRMFCAGFVFGGTDSCQGDSGGPFKINDKLAGIVSFGRGCAQTLSPGVYTDVFNIRSFIESTIESSSV